MNKSQKIYFLILSKIYTVLNCQDIWLWYYNADFIRVLAIVAQVRVVLLNLLTHCKIYNQQKLYSVLFTLKFCLFARKWATQFKKRLHFPPIFANRFMRKKKPLDKQLQCTCMSFPSNILLTDNIMHYLKKSYWIKVLFLHIRNLLCDILINAFFFTTLEQCRLF